MTVLVTCLDCDEQWPADWLPATMTDPACLADGDSCPRCGSADVSVGGDLDEAC